MSLPTFQGLWADGSCSSAPQLGPQHSKVLPNSKLILLRNGLEWGLSRGASCNWQEHIPSMGISRKNLSQKQEWQVSKADQPWGRSLCSSNLGKEPLKVTPLAIYWAFKLCPAPQSCAKCIPNIILFDLHSLVREVFFSKIKDQDTWDSAIILPQVTQLARRGEESAPGLTLLHTTVTQHLLLGFIDLSVPGLEFPFPHSRN